jgi:hypothetical protein
VIQIDVHHVGETRPTRHTHPTLSPRMVPDHTYHTRSMHTNLFAKSSTEMDRDIAPKKNSSWHNPQHVGWPIHGSVPIEAMGVNAPYANGRLLGLPNPYLRHAIDTFNTCSWGPTHQSLTDTGGGYNIGGAGFPHYTPRPSQPMVLHFPPKGSTQSQAIQSQYKLKWKWHETPIADPWSFNHSTSTEAYVYA